MAAGGSGRLGHQASGQPRSGGGWPGQRRSRDPGPGELPAQPGCLTRLVPVRLSSGPDSALPDPGSTRTSIRTGCRRHECLLLPARPCTRTARTPSRAGEVVAGESYGQEGSAYGQQGLRPTAGKRPHDGTAQDGGRAARAGGGYAALPGTVRGDHARLPGYVRLQGYDGVQGYRDHRGRRRHQPPEAAFSGVSRPRPGPGRARGAARGGEPIWSWPGSSRGR